MNLNHSPQLSPEWWELKVGKISGTRFGQATSNRKNRLLYDIINEKLSGYIEQDDYTSEEMQFGNENEPIARDLYIEHSGIAFEQVGAILSDFSPIHMASPDGLNVEKGIVLEIKCTSNGAIHLQRFFEGPEDKYMPQIKNYFAVSDDVKEVHWVSYCPYRPERKLVVFQFIRSDFITEDKKRGTVDEIEEGRQAIKALEGQLNDLHEKFIF